MSSDDDRPIELRPPQIEEAMRRIAACKRTRAEELDLGGLHLRDVPDEVADLPWLRRLFLGRAAEARKKAEFQLTETEKKSCNAVRALPARVLVALSGLEVLDLSFNQLTALPPEIGRLTALTHLWLYGNQLTALPPEIGRLTALTHLWLHGNQLTALPPEIGRLTALTRLSLDGNPLQTPPPEVVTQGVDAIRRFLLATASTGKPVYEAKVVLVGEAGVGKTQLREWHLKCAFVDIPPGASTRALEVRDCSIPNPHDTMQPGRINIWDFGGQDEYRPSQQLFFTEGALYLMLFNGRKGLAAGRVEEWLRLIRLRVGPKARVLLVATNAIDGDISPSLNELPLDLLEMCVRDEHGRPFRVNSREEAGRPVFGLLGEDGLIARVQREAAALPAFTQSWPGEWIETRDAALSPATYSEQDGALPGSVPAAIYYDRFQAIARGKRVDDALIHDLVQALSYSGRLTYKGTKDIPGQLVVLDSEWLMKAIGYVLAAKEVKATGGVLQRKDLRRIWETHEGLADEERKSAIPYPPIVHGQLLALMTKHDISYRLDEDSWLIGQCVSDAVPNPIPWKYPAREQGGTVLGLSCALSDKIHGLASLLTVRNHYHHVNHREHAWQRGVFLSHPLQKAEALIRVDGERRVDIETRGPDAGLFISELKGSLDKIIANTWRAGVEAEEKPYRYAVPCPSCEQGSYGYDDLRSDFHDGETEARCEGGKRCRNKVADLLEGFSRAYDTVALNRMLMRGATNEPPHIITITKVPGMLGGLLGSKYRIDIHCEYTQASVAGASDTLAFDTKMWSRLQEWGPGLFVSAAKMAMGMDFEIPGRRQIERRNQEFKDAVERTGRLERAPQTFIEQEFGDLLAKIARKGGMKQVEMHNDGRLLWVSADIADGQDPNKPRPA